MSKTGSRDLDKQSVLSTSLKVMVVDNKKEFLAHVGEFFSSRLFEVTCVDKAGTALNMLAAEKTDFDILLLDSDLRDVEMIPVLRYTKDMNILKIVMKEEADDAFLLEALENGAFLVVPKKLTNDTVLHVRQHVIRERIHKSGQFKVSSKSETKEAEKASPKEVDINAARKRERTCHAEENPDVHLLENENVSAKRSVSAMTSVSAMKRPCLEWTKELHSKFVSVVRALGDGNCFPKTILDAMGVPGLTRMQVASHLQVKF
ncbi:two-component response regulator ORR26 [Artemisia annua]|uniref:Two-component response regulator ORR26 n=1 Tax=Artemisia annua TaxID=35608 RepID=A0A2U1KLD4_ARTAN|nr:two-component response regulator ORR26 [Artemisia annua]